MRLADLRKALNDYNKGSYIRIEYVTDLTPSMKASAKRVGDRVEKRVEKTVRLGCDYHKMKSTIYAKANGRGTREMYEEEVIEDLLYQNKKNDTLYLRVGTVENDNNNTVWLLNGQQVDKEVVKDYLVPSYFNKKGSMEVQNIKLDNVRRLGRVN